jgi:hypothetical protein
LGAGDVVLAQHGADLVLGPHHLRHHPLSQDDQRPPGAHVHVRHVDVRDHVQQQELGQLLRVDPVVLAAVAVDQPQLRRVGDRDVGGQRPQRLVEVAVAAGRLVADAERLIELPQPLDDSGTRTFELNLIDRAAGGVANAQRRLTRMNV